MRRVVSSVPLFLLVAGLLASPTPACAGVPAARKAIWGPVTLHGRSAFPLYRRLGVGIFEIQLRWAVTAPTRPTDPRDPSDPAYRWPADVDAAVRDAKRYGMRVLLQIITTPEWANGGFDSTWAPLDEQDYAKFAAAAARRYPGVRLWMVWGEPTSRRNYNPLIPVAPGRALQGHERDAPQRYARMLDATYRELKLANSHNLVIGGDTYFFGDVSTRQWIDNLRLPDGLPPRMDLYGHNPFGAREPDLTKPPSRHDHFDFSDVARLHALVERRLRQPRGRTLKLFLSEWTVPTAPSRQFGYWVDPPVQARWIRSAFGIVRGASYIYALGWVHLIDDPPVTSGGLLRRDDSRKPGFYAFAAG